MQSYYLGASDQESIKQQLIPDLVHASKLYQLVILAAFFLLIMGFMMLKQSSAWYD